MRTWCEWEGVCAVLTWCARVVAAECHLANLNCFGLPQSNRQLM